MPCLSLLHIDWHVPQTLFLLFALVSRRVHCTTHAVSTHPSIVVLPLATIIDNTDNITFRRMSPTQSKIAGFKLQRGYVDPPFHLLVVSSLSPPVAYAKLTSHVR
jgi:hypothetical protein